MGSIDAACIAGFLCRLCSEMHRTVIHIYSDQGLEKKLASKINAYLPVTITPNDPLPKTICKTCMKRVEQHHELMIKIQKHRDVFLNSSPRIELIRLEETSTMSSHIANDQRSQSTSNDADDDDDEVVVNVMDTNSIDENDNTNNSSNNTNCINTRNDENSRIDNSL